MSRARPRGGCGDLDALAARLCRVSAERSGAECAVLSFIGPRGEAHVAAWPPEEAYGAAPWRRRGWSLSAPLEVDGRRMGSLDLLFTHGGPPPSDGQLSAIELMADLFACALRGAQAADLRPGPSLALVRGRKT